MRRALLVLVGGFGVLFATASTVPGCTLFANDICEYGVCRDGDASNADVAVGETSTDAKPDADPPPPGCDTPNEPLKNPEKCLVDSFGVFVSPTGDDGNPGTKAKPFKTLGKAIAAGRSRVVACEGTYAESLELGRDVEIYGALTCTFDKAGGATKLESGKATGLTVTAGTVGMFGLDVVAKDATEPGESSIGISLSPGVAFKMVGGSVSSGVGASALDGTTVSNYSPLPQNDSKIKGNDASGNTGGATQTCATLGCVDTVGTVNEGGGGGLGGGAGGSPAFDGKTAVPSAPANAGKGGLWDGLACGNGRPGADASGANGGAGATTPGTLEAAKWTVSRGTGGTIARPGQGGGGGSGGKDSGGANAGGGGGGCGGCGGGKGQGGLSGGSSFAVLSISANVTLENLSLKASAGGKGAKGGDGQVGQPGGLSGAPAASGIGCPGGLGGQGGQGGGGGGGAGGHSVALAYSGTKPTLKTVKSEFAPAPAAGGEPGATAATATQATAGAPGKTGADLAL